MLGELRVLGFNFWVNHVAAANFIPPGLRYWIYRLAGMDLQHASISPGCHFGGRMGPLRVRIGEGTFVNEGCRFDANDWISIGTRCMVGHEVLFVTATHDTSDPRCRGGTISWKPLVVEDGCWIGARAVILPGVTIGNGCVIAAGAVVGKDCAPHGLYAGVPASRIKNLPM